MKRTFRNRKNLVSSNNECKGYSTKITKDITAIDDVWSAYPSLDQHQVRAALARCGLKNEHISRPLSQLNGGKPAKVRLYKLMMEENKWLLFDEPTNHLDIIAKAALKKAMREFKGTIILVNHEPDFYEDWITKVWNVEEWAEKA